MMRDEMPTPQEVVDLLTRNVVKQFSLLAKEVAQKPERSSDPVESLRIFALLTDKISKMAGLFSELISKSDLLKLLDDLQVLDENYQARLLQIASEKDVEVTKEFISSRFNSGELTLSDLLLYIGVKQATATKWANTLWRNGKINTNDQSVFIEYLRNSTPDDWQAIAEIGEKAVEALGDIKTLLNELDS